MSAFWKKNLIWGFGLALSGLIVNAVLSYQAVADLPDGRTAGTAATARTTLVLTNGLNIALLLLVAAIIGRAIRRRERDAAALHASEARFRLLADSDLLGILQAEMTGRVREANDAFLRIVGYTREELHQGLVHRDRLTAPEHRADDEALVRQLRAGQATRVLEKELIRKDGTRVAVLLGAAPLEQGPDQYVAFVLDLSERKKAEAEVRRLNAELERRVHERTLQLEETNGNWSRSPTPSRTTCGRRCGTSAASPTCSASGSATVSTRRAGATPRSSPTRPATPASWWTTCCRSRAWAAPPCGTSGST
jgi:PAS domain S-box-containing protein